MKKLFIPIILGTARQGRESEKVAKWILKKVSEHPEIETRIFDPREMDYDFQDEGQNLKEKNTDYRDAIIRADGLIVIVPEYNRGYPGSLKMILDTLLKEYIHKPVATVGVSSGIIGGARVIENLLPVYRELGLMASFTDLFFPKVKTKFDEKGNLEEEEKYNKRFYGFITELLWVAKTLKWGRENVESKYHPN